MGLRESILKPHDLKREPFEADGWPAGVYVREFDGLARDQYEQDQLSRRDKNGVLTKTTGLRVKLLIACLCDADGVALFTEKDADALNKLPANMIDAAYEAAATLNGLMAKDEREAEKNSESEAGDGESSPSLYLSGERRANCSPASAAAN